MHRHNKTGLKDAGIKSGIRVGESGPDNFLEVGAADWYSWGEAVRDGTEGKDDQESHLVEDVDLLYSQEWTFTAPSSQVLVFATISLSELMMNHHHQATQKLKYVQN